MYKRHVLDTQKRDTHRHTDTQTQNSTQKHRKLNCTNKLSFRYSKEGHTQTHKHSHTIKHTKTCKTERERETDRQRERQRKMPNSLCSHWSIIHTRTLHAQWLNSHEMFRNSCFVREVTSVLQPPAQPSPCSTPTPHLDTLSAAGTDWQPALSGKCKETAEAEAVGYMHG